MSKKQMKIFIMTIIVIAFLALIGTSYAYYQVSIIENQNDKSVAVESENLAVKFEDGTSTMNFDGDFLFPGDTAEKTFTVENTGNANATYNILIDNVINEFERTQDLRYTIYIDDEEITTGAINNNEIQYLYYNREIKVGVKETIKFIFEYSESSETQNVDMNKNLSFRFNISSTKQVTNNTESNTLTFVSDDTLLNNYRIYGNSIQDGTPTPEAPIEVESVGDLVTDESDTYYGKYKIPITISGKNLFDYKSILENNSSTVTKVTYNERECISWINNASTSSQRFLEGIFDPNTLYYFTADMASSMNDAGYLSVVYTDGTNDLIFLFKFLSSAGEFGRVTTQIGNVNKTISYIQGFHNSAQILYLDINTVQLEKGSSSTEYEPFVEPTTYNIYLDEPLRKIGNTYDYIDFKDQMLYRNVEEKEFKGTESWYITETTSDGKYYLENVVPAGAAGPRRIISNYCTYSNDLTLNTCKAHGFADFDGWFGINVGLDKYSTVESYKEFLADQYSNGVPLKIYYEKQKNLPIKLPNLSITEKTNIITVGTSTDPSKIDIEL